MGKHCLSAVQHHPNEVILMRNELDVVIYLRNRVEGFGHFVLLRLTSQSLSQACTYYIWTPPKGEFHFYGLVCQCFHFPSRVRVTDSLKGNPRGQVSSVFVSGRERSHARVERTK